MPSWLGSTKLTALWDTTSVGHSTDDDGRVGAFLPAGTALAEGNYRLTFQTGAYFKAIATEGFYPEVSIVFEVTKPNEHHHVPLLLNPFGYSTYRGS